MTDRQIAEPLKRSPRQTSWHFLWSKAWTVLFAHRLVIYISIVLLASVGAYYYWVRTHTVFACQAHGYSAGRYLAYCNAANYGDFEHGAFQFNLEPTVERWVKNAEVLFLGNSRLQLALSSRPTRQWFADHSASYYLMGFTYFENASFEGPLLQRIRPRAKVFVIDVDRFFVRSESAPAHMVMHDPQAREKYEAKLFWQPVQEFVCRRLTWLCGHQWVLFRSRKTGAYYGEDAFQWKDVPVSYDSVADQNVPESQIAMATAFLSRFTRGKCVILTVVPYVGTDLGTAEAIAKGVGLPLVTPGNLEGLHTFDGVHLAPASAREWSRAFFKVAGPLIQACLANENTPERQALIPVTTARLGSSPATTR